MTSRAPVTLFLALAALLLVFSNGRWSLALLAFLAPAVLLAFLERTSGPRALAGALAAFLGAHLVMWRGLIPAPGLFYVAIAGSYAVIYFLPFGAHQLLARRLTPGPSTLVFPAAWVTCEALLARLSPYGTWVSLSYTQAEIKPLTQLLALTGPTGVSFLVAWGAATLGRNLGGKLEAARLVRPSLACAASLAAALALGEARFLVSPPPRTVVKSALLVASPSRLRPVDEALAAARKGGDLEALRASAAVLNDDLLARSRKAAQSGARIVAWSETAGRVLKGEEDAFLEQAGALAREQRIWLLAAYGTWNRGARPPFENLVVAFDPAGRVAARFAKAHPIVGAESSLVAAGDSRLPVIETEWGRISIAICHDLDFADLIGQAGCARVDLLFGPSADWKEVASFHARMARFRAIENGLTLARPAQGYSFVADAYGRVTALLGSAWDDPATILCDVPVGRAPALYPRIGDLFGWVCAAALALLAAFSATVPALSPR